jgi:hypothetical protein
MSKKSFIDWSSKMRVLVIVSLFCFLNIACQKQETVVNQRAVEIPDMPATEPVTCPEIKEDETVVAQIDDKIIVSNKNTYVVIEAIKHHGKCELKIAGQANQ